MGLFDFLKKTTQEEGTSSCDKPDEHSCVVEVTIEREDKMRDNLCDLEYLNKKLDLESVWLCRDKEKIQQLQIDLEKGIQTLPTITNEECIYNSKKGIRGRNRTILMAKYSRGDDIKTLNDEFNELYDIVTTMEISTDDGFILCDIISLGVLLEVDKQKIENIVKVVDDFKVDYPLFDKLCFLAGYERNITSNSENDDIRKFLIDIIDSVLFDKKDVSKEFCDYMSKKWYKALYGSGFKKAHTEPGYVGMWNLSGAAVSKLLKIDDSVLKEDNHYPYELRHYKNNYRFIDDMNESDKPKKITYKEGIPSHDKLEKIIPLEFHEKIENLLKDYNNLGELEFYTKYSLKNIWFDEETYIEARKDNMFLGTVLINLLAHLGYITALDWKEDLEDYDIENFWGDASVKLVQFDLNNDQCYYAFIPENIEIHNICGIVIYKVDSDM